MILFPETMDQNTILALRRLGMTSNELKVYLVLVELGSTLAGEIVKKTELHRPNVYDALERLIEKGFVTFIIQANRKYFEAKPPVALLDYLEEKQEELEEEKKIIAKIIPELEIKRKLGKEALEATIFKGKRGIKSMLEEVLRTKKDFLVYGAGGKFKRWMGSYYYNFHKRRKQKKIPVQIIYHERMRKEHREQDVPRPRQIRYNKGLDSPVTVYIFGDRVSITVWSEQPVATVIRSKEVSTSFRDHFRILWEKAKP